MADNVGGSGGSGGHGLAGGHGGTKAIVAAFLANLGIAIAKLLGFVFTGAASMLAEAVHSLADTSNQGLLLLGGRRASRPADAAHPFGFGRERYFWSFVVALVLFSAGGLFALFEGIEKLRTPHDLESPIWAIAILLIAIALESFSFRTAMKESEELRRGQSWFSFIRRTKHPELPVVLLEDTGALIGLAFALAGVLLAAATDNSRWDALGSVAIGLLLIGIAAVLAIEMKSLLIGESVSPDRVKAIYDALLGVDEIEEVADLRTEHLGPDDVLVVAKVILQPNAPAPEQALDIAEAAIRARVPEARLVYLEPDTRLSQQARP